MTDPRRNKIYGATPYDRESTKNAEVTGKPDAPKTLPDGSSQVGESLFPSWLLTIGFLAGLLFAGICLVSGILYLFQFSDATNTAIDSLLKTYEKPQMNPDILAHGINARMIMARFSLLSCGVYVGMSFGFLGFSLFLLGIKGEMDVQARSETYQVKLARISPGIFLMLCAAILVGVCVTWIGSTITYETTTTTSSPSSTPPASNSEPSPGQNDRIPSPDDILPPSNPQ